MKQLDLFLPTERDEEQHEFFSDAVTDLALRTAMIAGGWRALHIAREYGLDWLEVHLKQSSASALADFPEVGDA